ncbi:MAG: acetyl-CoA C-acyltransferase [Anaerolineales bacterium]|nr:acetyl-CoA C-acyltransferase [Anaerolineales bacterium]MCS7247540.1 acetyl-CoA C-acyltransferase [Anaerolineales bacterium]MDW8161351.1 acetyl-CoA C-acyltransferase [Anaerolineales bacterium]MDW8445845.1 acetyl-CoA C-acyltransferase [Anaerolineales bacterium]
MATKDPSRIPVIVAAARTAVGKAKRGSLATTRPEELASAVVQDLFKRAPGLEPQMVDDLILGCAFPEGEQGMNIARLVGLRAGLPVSVAAETINRFCSSGLQSIAHAAYAILAGQIEVAIAGGVESMSMVPMTGFKFAPTPYLAQHQPEVFTNMGLTAENVAAKYGISREDQDRFALQSHQKAIRAIEQGYFETQIVPVEVIKVELDEEGKTQINQFTFKVDEGPRKDTSLEALAKLKPAFKEGGTVTAGNSSQMSDGAAAVVIMSQAKAEELGLKPLARFVSFAVGGVAPEIMGIGPVVAIPKALKLAGLSLREIGLIELNEAFAAQSLAVIRELDLNPEILNVNGGAIALGHPLGCTGAKLTTQLIYEMKRRDVQFGMVTMCIGGGMGAAGIFENLPS